MAKYDEPHEFEEDVYDGSMCVCGISGLMHHTVYGVVEESDD